MGGLSSFIEWQGSRQGIGDATRFVKGGFHQPQNVTFCMFYCTKPDIRSTKFQGMGKEDFAVNEGSPTHSGQFLTIYYRNMALSV